MARSADRGPGLDGVLVLAKPSGPTSHDVVALVRRLAATKRVGHGGTLDPFAAGVLPVFLGRATRLVEYHMADGKAYRAAVCFGARSTTDDLEGELAPVDATPPDRAAVEAALVPFRGRILQRPPAFSALKVSGRRAYELARAGTPPELAPREVTIGRLELVAWDGADPARPVATLEIECGAGTYIRALARDLGEALGCGAYLGSLVRTASGPFRLADALSLDALRDAAADGAAGVARLLGPIDAGLDQLPRLVLPPAEVRAAVRGQRVRPERRPVGLADGSTVRLVDEAGTLVGVATWQAGRLAPDKILVPLPPADDVAAGPSEVDRDASSAGDVADGG
ncbi:MAG TPA: tRNA pseudouridine(55) synthase TruB [Candidatus Limnocylindrales bacterium]